MLEDVERIGGGGARARRASLWGRTRSISVINIVTRKATATRGGLGCRPGWTQGHDAALAMREGVDLEG